MKKNKNKNCPDNLNYYTTENNYNLSTLDKTISYLGLIMLLFYVDLEKLDFYSMTKIFCKMAISQSNN